MSQLNEREKVKITTNIMKMFHQRIEKQNDYDSCENSCNNSADSIFENKNQPLKKEKSKFTVKLNNKAKWQLDKYIICNAENYDGPSIAKVDSTIFKETRKKIYDLKLKQTQCRKQETTTDLSNERSPLLYLKKLCYNSSTNNEKGVEIPIITN